MANNIVENIETNNIHIKLNEIFTKIDLIKQENKNVFLLNLWKNYVKIKINNLIESIKECEIFLKNIENGSFENNSIEINENISYETIVLIYSLFTTLR